MYELSISKGEFASNCLEKRERVPYIPPQYVCTENNFTFNFGLFKSKMEINSKINEI